MNKPLLVIALASLLGVGCSRDEGSAAPLKGNAAAGKTVAETKCVSCHGADGLSPSPETPHLAGQREPYLLKALHEYKDGLRGHPSLQQMVSQVSAKEMADAAAYFASLKPAAPDPALKVADAPEVDPLEQGKAAAAMCAGCHGEDGNAAIPGTPSLAGQQQDYLIAALEAYQTGKRNNDTMAGLAATLDKAGVASVALYYASQKPVGRGKPEAGDAAAGESLAAGCTSCHGEKGNSGDSKMPSLAGQDAESLVAALKAYRDGGRQNDLMKGAVAPMSDQDIQNVAAYFSVQEPKGANVIKPLMTAEWVERCERCHAPGVNNSELIIPRLDAQRYEYLVKSLKAYRDGSRQHSTMHAMGGALDDATIEKLARHYAGLPVRR